MKICIACGMPMKEAEDFAMQDTNKEYCKYCAREDGSMKSFTEAKESMMQFMIQTQGISTAVAEEAVAHTMKKLPAWKNHFRKEE